MTNGKLAVAESGGVAESVANTPMEYVPAVVGVPVISPLFRRVSPGGMAEVLNQAYGHTPPVALRMTPLNSSFSSVQGD
jgi:hypothetical protein